MRIHFSGMLYPREHLRVLKMIDVVDPSALSQDVKDVLNPDRNALEEATKAAKHFEVTARLLADNSLKNNLSEQLRSVLIPEQVHAETLNREYSQKMRHESVLNTDAADLPDETVFVIDINIDGVQLFKNSMVPQAIPILARIYSIADYVIPLTLAKPFIFGVYHGCHKPPIEAYLQDMFADLYELAPERGKGYRGRKLAVKVRCFICDTPIRCYLKGTTSHAGYSGCERCKVFGTRYGKAVRFTKIDCAKRRDKEWEKYAEEDPGEDENFRHRHFETPFDDSDFKERMISGFIIDPMHILDGGACGDAIRYGFGVEKKQQRVSAKNKAVS